MSQNFAHSACDAQNFGLHGSVVDPRCKDRSEKCVIPCLFDVYVPIVQATNLERNPLVAQNFETVFTNFMTTTQNLVVTPTFCEACLSVSR